MKIKFRESFRPFAPIVMADHASRWFDIRPDQDSPYMLLVAPVRPAHRTAIPADQRTVMNGDPNLCHRVNVVRSTIPAVTHVDYSARLQTVDEERHPRLYRLMQHFLDLTGCPVLVNTSFNVRGEPIVCTPQDAYRCFLGTDMDALVLGDVVLHRDDFSRQDESGVRRNTWRSSSLTEICRRRLSTTTLLPSPRYSGERGRG